MSAASASPRPGVARRDHRHEIRQPAGKAPVRLEHQRLLARVGAGSEPHRPLADRGGQARERLRIGRQGRRCVFEVAGRGRLRGAKRREPRPIGLALGQAEREAAAKLRSASRQPLPAPERALRDAPVDQRQWQAPRARLEDQVRPQLGFDQHAELRAPVREERAPGLRPVDRRELMARARRQLSGHQRRRSHRSGGHQHLQGGALRQQRLDQGQERAGFADACGMQPQQRPLRTRHARGAEALAPTQGILLAAPRPPPQLRLDQGPAQRGGAAIQLQQHQATDTSSRSRSGSPMPWPANCCRYSPA